MKSLLALLFCILCLFHLQPASGADKDVSDATEECLNCHARIHPGIVGDWRRSRHAQVTPAQAMEVKGLSRKISADQIPDELKGVVVGCAECHTLRPKTHKDTFDHNGHDVHIVVSPRDCATCHRVEDEQYGQNTMSHAYGNLKNNLVYDAMVQAASGVQVVKDMKTTLKPPDKETLADSCFFCHGTLVEVKGMKARDTEEGKMEFPALSGWPNQGVGRINPDGSQGACTPCHTRHQFGIEMARKAYTCAECHKGPDVPATRVYDVSKHGNLFASEGTHWDFKAVPWQVGKDFTAPTCAVCHMSLLVGEGGEVISERTHRMNDRLPWRLFGLIYAHPHPKTPDTTMIRNKGGLPLPTELTGEPATGYLIDKKEQGKRLGRMQKACLACHSQGWVGQHFVRLEQAIKTSNEMTLAATEIILSAWQKGAARGMAQGDSLFNEALEKRWVEQWLFYANSVRFASAMAGADYGVFADGRWQLAKNIQEMLDHLELKLRMKK